MVRFDQPCYVVGGAVEYFREHMALGDYLTQSGQSEMTWFGAGAERLGLAGQCDLTAFANLCRGFHPTTGEKLMVRDKGARRRVCYFGQISPPKDVSILHLVAGDQRIAAWWQESVEEALREIEAVAATRVRRGGVNADRATGNVVGAIVTHDANRALDPQLHTHVCFMNLTWDQTEGRWKSLQASGLYRHQGYFREVSYNRLAIRMREAGYELEPNRGIGFTVKGLPPDLREKFSKRRRAILREFRDASAATQDDLQAVALATRARKTTATAATLRERWAQECGDQRAVLESVVARATHCSVAPLICSGSEAVLSAERRLFERVSVADDRVLLREALTIGRGQVTLVGLKGALASRERAGGLLRSGQMLASREALEAEKEFAGWAYSVCDAYPPLGGSVLATELSADQQSAVSGLLASTAAVSILQGDAGTGKTTALRPLVAGIHSAGHAVFGCAPSASAVQVLRTELTPEAETLQRLLVDQSLEARIRGRVVLVDEAGLISVSQMRDLCRLAARNGNRLVLVGDIKQHHSVEAGDALRALQQYGRVPTFRLTEIHRQRDPAYRRAVALLAQGDAFAAFGCFNRMGAVHERDGGLIWHDAAADYLRTLQAGKRCLAISPVWSEIHAFTAAVRGLLRTARILEGPERACSVVHSLDWTREEKRRVASYRPNDVLTFFASYGQYAKLSSYRVVRTEGRLLVLAPLHDPATASRFDPSRTSSFDVGLEKEIPVAIGERLLIRSNLPAADLRNGDIVEVAGFDRDGGIRLRDTRLIPAWFRDFCHGYATTSHASQGRTVDRGILLMGPEGIRAGNLKQAYVSNSRFRESQAIYTTDKAAARDAMMRPDDRLLAMELPVPPGEPAPPVHAERAAIGSTPKAA